MWSFVRFLWGILQWGWLIMRTSCYQLDLWLQRGIKETMIIKRLIISLFHRARIRALSGSYFLVCISNFWSLVKCAKLLRYRDSIPKALYYIFLLTYQLAHVPQWLLNANYDKLWWCSFADIRGVRIDNIEPPHDKTKKMTFAPSEDRSAQSDQSSLSAWRIIGSLGTHKAHSEHSDQTGWMPRLIWVFARRTGHIIGFLMTWLK